MTVEPERTRAWFVKELGLTLKMVDAGTTISGNDEITAVVRALIEEFPAMKIEEYMLVFDAIRKGKWKLYNRLKLPELMECVRDWEARRAEQILERTHRPEYDPYRRKSTEVERPRAILLSEQDILDLGQIKPRGDA